MNFNSFEYGFFLALVVVVCWALPRLRWQNIFLLAASYFFYASWDWRFLGLILLSTTVDYWMARAMPSAPPQRRKLLLSISLITDLGVLGFFKYFNFFVDSAASLLNILGVHANPSSLQIILPLGISFYTFQALSYTIEVYRGNLQPTRSFINYALFIALFPQLAAGPIERAARMLPQIENPRTIDGDRVESALVLILLGLFKKMVIADVAAALIDPAIFSSTIQFTGAQVLAAVYLFAVQIYADFSGYSDIARGSARLLGFELMENFNQPYFAANIADFWRRWHISLSIWLRDYIFFPFSRAMLKRYGSSRATAIQIAAHMLTMLASGLWHGANWTFVLWGGLHGVYLSVHRLLLHHKWLPVKIASPFGKRIGLIVSIIITFHLVLAAWVLFRAPSIAQVSVIFSQIGSIFTSNTSPFDTSIFVPVILLFAAAFAIDVGQILTRDHAFTTRLSVPLRTVLYSAAIICLIVFSLKPYVPFIYFQF
jgi:D-alanyl-lipoteichoic acid acyltransferase DltB (MBOAT superfamily)